MQALPPCLLKSTVPPPPFRFGIQMVVLKMTPQRLGDTCLDGGDLAKLDLFTLTQTGQMHLEGRIIDKFMRFLAFMEISNCFKVEVDGIKKPGTGRQREIPLVVLRHGPGHEGGNRYGSRAVFRGPTQDIVQIRQVADPPVSPRPNRIEMTGDTPYPRIRANPGGR
jgi:hypothetical protein